MVRTAYPWRPSTKRRRTTASPPTASAAPASAAASAERPGIRSRRTPERWGEQHYDVTCEQQQAEGGHTGAAPAAVSLERKDEVQADENEHGHSDGTRDTQAMRRITVSSPRHCG
jgi:hypothetical protein